MNLLKTGLDMPYESFEIKLDISYESFIYKA